MVSVPHILDVAIWCSNYPPYTPCRYGVVITRLIHRAVHGVVITRLIHRAVYGVVITRLIHHAKYGVVITRLIHHAGMV